MLGPVKDGNDVHRNKTEEEPRYSRYGVYHEQEPVILKHAKSFLCTTVTEVRGDEDIHKVNQCVRRDTYASEPRPKRPRH